MKICKISDPKNNSDIIFNVISDYCEFFIDNTNEPFFVSYNNSGYDLIYINCADESKKFFTGLYFKKYNATVKTSDVNVAYITICAILKDCNHRVPVFTRIGKTQNTIFYDLCNASGEIIKIESSGVQKVKKSSLKNFFFYSNQHMQAQLTPTSSTYSLLDFVNSFLNVKKNQRILFAVYVCATFIPEISHPILILEGEKGAGKTYTAKQISKLVNPTSNEVFVLPKKTDDLITTISNNLFSVFDNIGTLSPEFCNVFCQVSTGGTLIKRKLFSDNAEVAINIKRLVVLTGINMGIDQSDMLDRSILIRLNRIEPNKRLPDEILKSEIQKVLPSVLADIFNILSKSIPIYENLTLSTYPRMADFAKYGYAIAEAIKEGMGQEFITEYEENIRVATQYAIEENPLLECIKHIVDRDGVYKGKMSNLLLEIKKVLPNIYISKTLPDSFPKSANSLSKKLKVCKHELKTLGIKLEIGRATERYVHLEKISDSTVDIVDNDEFAKK